MAPFLLSHSKLVVFVVVDPQELKSPPTVVFFYWLATSMYFNRTYVCTIYAYA